MAAFVRVNPGDPMQAHQLNQVIDALDGAAGAGVPIAVTAVNDTTNYALTVQNDDPTNSRALLVQKSDGTTLIQADVNGVVLALANGSVPNAALGPDVARASMLVNGSLDIWQRGNGPFSNTGAADYTGQTFTTDRWAVAGIGTDTLAVSRDTSNMDAGSAACAVATYTLGNSSGVTALHQVIAAADAPSLRGRQVSLSVRVRTSTANAVRAFINDGAVNTPGTVHTGSGTYQTLTVTATPAAGQARFVVGVQFLVSCTAYIDNAMLVVGSQPASYAPLHPADDLHRCQRYYEILGGPGLSDVSIMGVATSAQAADLVWAFRAEKPITPTVTKVGTWGVSLSGQPSVSVGTSTRGVVLEIVSSGAGQFFARNSGAGNYATSEANP